MTEMRLRGCGGKLERLFPFVADHRGIATGFTAAGISAAARGSNNTSAEREQ
jgi:hypothetical protein